MPPIALALHGGCGTLARKELSEAEWAEAADHLAGALAAGWAILAGGGRALDAVQAAVVAMEDSPHFNAGHGAALNADGEHELDSSIMDGRTLAAGAVTTARRIRNPVKAARALLEGGRTVLLAGPAADRFAEEAGLDIVDNGYFTTPRRVQALAAMKAHARDGTLGKASEAEKHGTVGAAALDRSGDLGAATSTGGFTNKPPGRVGDTPIIGAGTYARNGVCAVSGTGMGEYFIRTVAGHEVASLMAYRGLSLDQATHQVVFDRIGGFGIGAGMAAVDAHGNVAVPFNTLGMYRGWVLPTGECFVATHTETLPRGRLPGGQP
jgi:beta-aspartyl-peptidase (threonine type)